MKYYCEFYNECNWVENYLKDKNGFFQICIGFADYKEWTTICSKRNIPRRPVNEFEHLIRKSLKKNEEMNDNTNVVGE